MFSRRVTSKHISKLGSNYDGNQFIDVTPKSLSDGMHLDMHTVDWKRNQAKALGNLQVLFLANKFNNN